MTPFCVRACPAAVFLWFVAMMPLVGCQSALMPTPYTADVGSVSMTATSMGRWEDVRSKLVPNFDLDDADEALERVLPDTARRQRREFSGESAGFSAAFPTTEPPPAVGDDGSFGGRTAAGLPDLKQLLADGDLEVDPLLQYQLANALFQEVQLLDEYITRTAIPENYTPHVVRLLLRPDVNPWFDQTDVDAYITISFFKTLEQAAEDGEIRVLPLLVTDHIEAALASRSVEELKRLAVALSVADNGIGGTANYQSVLDTLESSLAREQNSLLSVTRESDNSIRVRLGGNYTSGNREVATRNHPITLVVLVKNGTDVNEIEVASYTRFRLSRPNDAGERFFPRYGGASRQVQFTQPVPFLEYGRRGQAVLLDSLVAHEGGLIQELLPSSVGKRFLRALIWYEISRQVGKTYWPRQAASNTRDFILDLGMSAATNNPNAFYEKLDPILDSIIAGDSWGLPNEGFGSREEVKRMVAQAVWTQFVETFSGMEYGKTVLALARLRTPFVRHLREGESFLLQTNGKVAQVRIAGENLDAPHLQATLSVGGVLLVPTQQQASAGGDILTVSFGVEGVLLSDDDTPLYLYLEWRNIDEGVALEAVGQRRFPLSVATVPKPAASGPPAAIRVSSMQVTPAVLGEGDNIVVRLQTHREFNWDKIKSIRLRTSVPASVVGGDLQLAPVNGAEADTEFLLSNSFRQSASANLRLQSFPDVGSDINFTLIVTPKDGMGESYPISVEVQYQPTP